MIRYFFIVLYLSLSNGLFAQYNMQDLTVYDCEGTLKDSESNIASPTYYTNGENYSFTICPPNAVTIVITFLEFETEPINDYLRIFNGPDTNSAFFEIIVLKNEAVRYPSLFSEFLQ